VQLVGLQVPWPKCLVLPSEGGPGNLQGRHLHRASGCAHDVWYCQSRQVATETVAVAKSPMGLAQGAAAVAAAQSSIDLAQEVVAAAQS